LLTANSNSKGGASTIEPRSPISGAAAITTTTAAAAVVVSNSKAANPPPAADGPDASASPASTLAAPTADLSSSSSTPVSLPQETLPPETFGQSEGIRNEDDGNSGGDGQPVMFAKRAPPTRGRSWKEGDAAMAAAIEARERANAAAAQASA
jgi:hypothetical protein